MAAHPTTTANVSADAFASGWLAQVCVVSGEVATSFEKKSVESPVGAAWLGLLLGFIPFFIIRSITVKTVVGGVPYNKEAAKRDPVFVERRQRNLIGGAVALVLGVGAVALAGSTVVDQNGSWPAVFGLGGAVLVMAALFLLAFGIRSPIAWIAPRFLPTTGTVVFHRVHPTFAGAHGVAGYSPWPAAVPVPTIPPAGWYPDPVDASRTRYWDGERWSPHVATAAGQLYEAL